LNDIRGSVLWSFSHDLISSIGFLLF